MNEEFGYGFDMASIPTIIVPANEVTTYDPVMHDLFCNGCGKKTGVTYNGLCNECWIKLRHSEP